mmetsp:Transcript_12013/g.43866  ORF Transcript_12013/g.43866 Transcript_12013/m.43866 type:complete len:220 (-) Transcript_12013:3401-4060(-)
MILVHHRVYSTESLHNRRKVIAGDTTSKLCARSHCSDYSASGLYRASSPFRSAGARTLASPTVERPSAATFPLCHALYCPAFLLQLSSCGTNCRGIFGGKLGSGFLASLLLQMALLRFVLPDSVQLLQQGNCLSLFRLEHNGPFLLQRLLFAGQLHLWLGLEWKVGLQSPRNLKRVELAGYAFYRLVQRVLLRWNWYVHGLSHLTSCAHTLPRFVASGQ